MVGKAMTRGALSVGTLGAFVMVAGCAASDRPHGPPVVGFDLDGAVLDSSTGLGGDGGVPDAQSNPDAPIVDSSACHKMDILFVIDDSGSMEEEQANLAANFPRFVEVLDAFRTTLGSELDYRVGVTTTGVTADVQLEGFPFPLPNESVVGADGRLRSGCGTTRPWIESTDADVAGEFACLADVGIMGSGYEMPLYALELALSDRVADGSNAGFLREDALLAVVVLTDEDDCSRRDNPITLSVDLFNPAALDACEVTAPQIVPAADFATLLDRVKGDRGRWAAAIIAGPGPQTCTSSFGDALPANRLRSFVETAGDNATFSSICDGDLSASLSHALETFDAACQEFPPLI